MKYDNPFNSGDIVWAISSWEYPKKCNFCNGKKDTLYIINSKGKKIKTDNCPVCGYKGYTLVNEDKFTVRGRFKILQITVTSHESKKEKPSAEVILENVDKNALQKRLYTCVENLFKDKKSAQNECNRRNKE